MTDKGTYVCSFCLNHTAKLQQEASLETATEDSVLEDPALEQSTESSISKSLLLIKAINQLYAQLNSYGNNQNDTINSKICNIVSLIVLKFF